jgi:hypothetical protein
MVRIHPELFRRYAGILPTEGVLSQTAYELGTSGRQVTFETGS